MNTAAQLLVGHYDFRNLSTAQLERQDTKRECYSATVEPINEHLGKTLNLSFYVLLNWSVCRFSQILAIFFLSK